MQFGIQFFPIISPGKPTQQYFNECLSLAQQAEELGFTHARVVEHYFKRYGGLTPNPLVLLSALSQRTRTMRLVTGAVLPVFNNPLKVAGEIGMVDALSGGRLDVGFARAFLPHEFRRFHISPDESQARFKEGIEQIELLLSQDVASHRGQFFSFENVTSTPRPTQKPRPKFYVAATQTPETFEFAGRNGYALMAIPIGNLRPLLDLYRKTWREAKHEGNGEVMVAFHMFCHRDSEKARRIARGPFDLYFDAMNECTRDWADGQESKDYKDYSASMKKLQAVTLEDQIETGGAWVGTPDEIARTIVGIVDTIGPFEHASLQVNFGDMSYEHAKESLGLFCSSVLPSFS